MAGQDRYQVQFSEYWEERSGLTLGITNVLFSQQTPYQHVQVWETDAFGRLLTLHGVVMLTDRDEFVYHEMISHPALCLLPDPRRVLVVGGGDGGAAREILRHPQIEHVDMVEIDEVVLDVARTYFPAVSAGLDDPRLRVHIGDGIEFVRNAAGGSYDLVVVDSTDPVGMAEGLFGEAFYRDCARVLDDAGILVAQMESPFDREFRATIHAAQTLLRRIFPITETYLAFISTYAMGMWSFALASQRLHPVHDYKRAAAEARLRPFADSLQYYNPDVHLAAFALPNFVRRMLP